MRTGLLWLAGGLAHGDLRIALWMVAVMVAGIIAAAGADELTIAHPTDEATVATTALILGSPAPYLSGNALFKWAIWDRLPRSRLVALCALAALVPLAVASSTLVLLVAATLVVISVSLWDMRTERMKFTENVPRSHTSRPRDP